jgi:hypothetical protein
MSKCPPTQAATPVSWEFWIQVGRLEAWKACALSVDVEPSSLEFELDDGADVLLSWTMADDREAEFSRRCEIVKTHVGSPELPCLNRYGGSLGEGDQVNSLVSIHEFVSWARSRSWPLPPSMTPLIPFQPDTGSRVEADEQSQAESIVERNARIVKRLAQLKKEGKRNWTETVAKEEGLSPAWIRDIAAEARVEADRVEESKESESLQEKEGASTSRNASNPLKNLATSSWGRPGAK